MKYFFMYRFLNGLNNNSLFHKIFSFEIHFFTKVGVLRLEKAQTLLDPNDLELNKQTILIKHLRNIDF